MGWKDLNKRKEYNNEYYQNHKESRKQYFRQYHSRNKEKIMVRHKQWWGNNQDHIKAYRIKNRERTSQVGKQYRAKNKEHIKEYHKWFESTPERKAYRKKWNKENPRSHGYDIELEFAMNTVRIRDKNTCQWQGCGLTYKQVPIDVHHIFPRKEYPELELIEQYMICYCLNHHALFHQYRGDHNIVQLIRNRFGIDDQESIEVD